MASACSVAVATEQDGIGSDFLRTPAATSCILVSISFVCACFLVVCGVLVVREYTLASAYDVATQCQLRNVSYSPKDVSCLYCSGFKDKSQKDKGSSSCISSIFPCVRLLVSYQIQVDQSKLTNKEALLHPDSLQASGPHSQCSYSVCLKSREDNQLAVDKFIQEWVDKTNDYKTTFTCYYNKQELRSSVIAHKTYSISDVVHSMLWPSVVVIICAVIFLRLEMHRRQLTFCGTNAPSAAEIKHRMQPQRMRRLNSVKSMLSRAGLYSTKTSSQESEVLREKSKLQFQSVRRSMDHGGAADHLPRLLLPVYCSLPSLVDNKRSLDKAIAIEADNLKQQAEFSMSGCSV